MFFFKLTPSPAVREQKVVLYIQRYRPSAYRKVLLNWLKLFFEEIF